jgi:predicted anti-sigma-YlaC factor YlaD
VTVLVISLFHVFVIILRIRLFIGYNAATSSVYGCVTAFEGVAQLLSVGGVISTRITAKERSTTVRCHLTPERWQAYRDTGDTQVAAHLASCAACRAEAAKQQRLADVLATLAPVEAPAAVRRSLDDLQAALAGRVLSCEETRVRLEPYREGDLDATQSFLVQDHLFWCDECSRVFAQAESLAQALRALPSIAVPEAVAERVAAGRLPWWQRLLPAFPLQRVAWAAMAVAVFVMLYAGVQWGPRVLTALMPKAPATPQQTDTPAISDQSTLVTLPANPVTPREIAPDVSAPTPTVQPHHTHINRTPQPQLPKPPAIEPPKHQPETVPDTGMHDQDRIVSVPPDKTMVPDPIGVITPPVAVYNASAEEQMMLLASEWELANAEMSAEASAEKIGVARLPASGSTSGA